MIGRITSTLSLIRLQKYSLFQKYNALSATCVIVIREVLFEQGKRLTYLKMWTSNRLSQLVEQRLLDFSEFTRIHDLKNVFDLIEKHDFFRTVHFWPISQKA